MLIKAQLHFHTSLDPYDRFLKYSPYEAIDKAYENWYKIISFTHHLELIYDNKLKNYALDKWIILIPWVEYNIWKKHVLIYNADDELYNVKTFEDLIEYKKHRKRLFIIAPHPFYPFISCLKKRNMYKYHSLFDAIEFSAFYTWKLWLKANQKVVDYAKEFNKPIVWNSDVHNLKTINDTYSLVDVNFDIENLEKSKIDSYINDFFESIRLWKVKVVTYPLTLRKILVNNLWLINWVLKRSIKNTLRLRKRKKVI